MASSGTGGTAVGLQALGSAAGIAGSLITSQQGKQDKRISNGQEDPAIAALRKRLAAQNAQTAMSIAASQQGVNPALAQRNAQQALAQQQVQTNANLAQNNVQSTLASRAATRGQQHQQIAGTALGIGQGLVGLGTGMGAQAAYDASGEGVPGNTPQESAAGLGSALSPQGAAGLSAPVPSESAAGLAAPPQGSQSYLDALQSADHMTRQNPALQQTMPQMQGGTPQVMGQGLGQIQASPAAGQAMATPSMQEAAVGQPVAPVAPPQATPVPQASAALTMRGRDPQVTSAAPAPQAPAAQSIQTPQVTEQAVGQTPASPPGELSTVQRIGMIPDSAYADPMNSGLLESIGQAEARGNEQMAEILRRALLQQVGML